METDVYTQWQEGTLSPAQALNSLCSDLGEIESELQPLQSQRERLRDQIGNLLLRMDGYKAEVKGFGRLSITAPAITERYDASAIDTLLVWLTEQEYIDIAERLAACKVQSMRSGGLRIERERSTQ